MISMRSPEFAQAWRFMQDHLIDEMAVSEPEGRDAFSIVVDAIDAATATDKHWYAAQVHQRREDDPIVVTAILAYRSPEQAKAAVEAMHLVGAEGRDAYVWPPDEAATLSRLPRSQAAYRAIKEEVRRRWGDT